MKKTTKFLLGGTLLTLGVMTLTSCTSSFCSTKDKAHMMYAFDYGVTRYYEAPVQDVTEETPISIQDNDYYVSYSISNCPALLTIVEGAQKSNIATPSVNFFKKVDEITLKNAIQEAGTDYDFSNMNQTEGKLKNDFLKKYGYVKFYYSTNVSYTHTAIRWENWDNIINEAKRDTSIGVDELPGDDFVAYYKKQMTTFVNAYRSCIATKDGEYGYYGQYGDRSTIVIENKTYAYAWSRGFFEGLLIWPIAALTDVIANGFISNGVAHGVASILAIIIITIIVRSVMLLFTAKQTANTAKMNELQPELAKIQAKYPNANTSQNEKMRLAEETQKLYKKYNIHPLRSILVMFVQFPVFICVWGALQGSAVLSTGSFLGLNLSSSISSILFKANEWAPGGGALTALFLFILMALAQAAAMLLPQFIQKYKSKKIAKLGKNPAKKQNDRRMQMFTYIMLVMIIVMGFSLASGMGVYWLVGALFSIAQTFIMQAINDRKSKKEKRR